MSQGLLDWANSIRLTMENDPGRQYFKDQIQGHGFGFLDDYLDNILSGPRKDPLIELVKTPGRKRATTKPKTASKLSHAVSFSLESDPGERVNAPPLNDFHKALIHSKDGINPQSHNGEPQLITETSTSALSRNIDILPSPSAAHNADIPQNSPRTHPPLQSQPEIEESKLTPIPQHDPKELSIIAEDDELHETSPVHSGRSLPPESEASTSLPPPEERTEAQGKLNATGNSEGGSRTSALADTLHTAPLGSSDQSPQEDAKIETTPQPSSSHSHHRQRNEEEIQKTQRRELSFETVNASKQFAIRDLIDNPTSIPLPEEQPTVAVSRSPDPHSIPKNSDYIDVDVPLQDTETQGSPKSFPSKASVPAFPPLPGPLPLRKSLRVTREPSFATTVAGAATPGAAIGGKRTSWLMKAREVNALATGVKKPGFFGADAVSSETIGPSTGSKRKSSEMLGPGDTAAAAPSEERQRKVLKSGSSDIAPRTGSSLETNKAPLSTGHTATSAHPAPSTSSDDVLGRFKKTVSGLGARSGKSIGPPLDSTRRATALAEARALAEAAVAERKSKEDETIALTGAYFTEETAIFSRVDRDSSDHRLSISDLTSTSKDEEKGAFEKTCAIVNKGQVHQDNGASSSTTPPHSPQDGHRPVFTVPSKPVFSKQPQVFIPPNSNDQEKPKAAAIAPNGFVFSLPPSNAFSLPVPMSVGLAPRFGSPPTPSSPKRNSPFSNVSKDNERAPDDSKEAFRWVPASEEKDNDQTASTHFSNSDPTHQFQFATNDAEDDDDSWRLEEKLSDKGTLKEDNTTWSTFASNRVEPFQTKIDSIPANAISQFNHPVFDVDVDMDPDEDGYDEEPEAEILAEAGAGDSELEDILIHAKPTIALVQPKRSESLESMPPPAQPSGIFGQAAKLLQNALGTGKKPKPEPKSESRPEAKIDAKTENKKKPHQLGPLATKKQEEDKKVIRPKEIENRRHLVTQKKAAEEERAKTAEREKKLKEENERRKREREEHTDKRQLKPLGGVLKKEDDATKKRKIVPEIDKKPEFKKLPTLNLGPPKSAIKSSFKIPGTQNSSAIPSSVTKHIKATDLRVKGKTTTTDDDISQPSQILQSQMAARAKAQLQATESQPNLHQASTSKHVARTSPIGLKSSVPNPPTVASEEIELPEVNSEYSDSEDESRPRYQGPEWTRSPELQAALRQQSTIDPDEVFGQVLPPLNMEEIFNKTTNKTRFRARTSSANWNGPDGLSRTEIQNYKRRMGFDS